MDLLDISCVIIHRILVYIKTAGQYVWLYLDLHTINPLGQGLRL